MHINTNTIKMYAETQNFGQSDSPSKREVTRAQSPRSSTYDSSTTPIDRA